MRATPTGLFISFEGIDGAGKSTHIESVADLFRAQGRVVTVTREPGGTPLAEKLRALVLNDAMDPMIPQPIPTLKQTFARPSVIFVCTFYAAQSSHFNF